MSNDALRLDRFLCRARLFKRRTEAQRQIASGQVLLNGLTAKPAHPVHPGDRLFIRYLRFDLEAEVLATPAGQVSRTGAAELVRILRRLPGATS